MTPEQLEKRIEKRALVSGYCWRVLPMWFVDWCFRVLRLKHV